LPRRARDFRALRYGASHTCASRRADLSRRGESLRDSVLLAASLSYRRPPSRTAVRALTRPAAAPESPRSAVSRIDLPGRYDPGKLEQGGLVGRRAVERADLEVELERLAVADRRVHRIALAGVDLGFLDEQLGRSADLCRLAERRREGRRIEHVHEVARD